MFEDHAKALISFEAFDNGNYFKANFGEMQFHRARKEKNHNWPIFDRIYTIFRVIHRNM